MTASSGRRTKPLGCALMKQARPPSHMSAIWQDRIHHLASTRRSKPWQSDRISRGSPTPSCALKMATWTRSPASGKYRHLYTTNLRPASSGDVMQETGAPKSAFRCSTDPKVAPVQAHLESPPIAHRRDAFCGAVRFALPSNWVSARAGREEEKGSMLQQLRRMWFSTKESLFPSSASG